MATKIMDQDLPRLTWIAEQRLIDQHLIINYGRDVEVGDNFIVEGVWDGQYKDLDYDISNHFFGSGLKILNGELIVVPSTGLVDRVFIGESKEKYYVSNSLIEILARTGSKLISSHNYKIQTDTIRGGIKNYINDYPISSQILLSLRQFFYHPIKIIKNSITINERPISKSFKTYDEYVSEIVYDLDKISLNASSPFRKKPIDLYTTVSKGYDSTAVTALTAGLPIKKSFTCKFSNSSMLGFFNRNWNDDDGTIIAKKLSLKVAYLDFKESEIDSDELYFLAATTGGPELQLYKLHKILTSNENPNIVFTGYHGDTVWALSPPKKALTDDIVKPGASGLTLSEIRLKSGFIDIPVPMMYARSIVSINHLSTSDEMSKWSIGGDYDRPIPRRILESQGIERNEFGMKKRAVATFYDLPRNKKLKREFLCYMRATHKKSTATIKISRFKDQLAYYSKMLLYTFDQLSLKTGKIARPLDVHTIDTPYYMHIWSLSKLVETRSKELDSGFKKES
ncbi:MAG: hypothetical protein ACTHZ7_14765 [Sphingobacterium sp.]